MSDIDARITELKARTAALERNKIVLELKRQAAEEQYEKAQRDMLENYGVSSVQQAKELLNSLETAVLEKISEIEQQLDKFEGRT